MIVDSAICGFVDTSFYCMSRARLIGVATFVRWRKCARGINKLPNLSTDSSQIGCQDLRISAAELSALALLKLRREPLLRSPGRLLDAEYPV